MKKNFIIYITIFLVSIGHFFSQSSLDLEKKVDLDNSIPTIEVTAPNVEQLKAEDIERENQGLMYRIGIATTVNLNPENSGIWQNLPNGSRKWQIIIKSKGAEALSFLFDKFVVYGGTTLEITDLNGKLVHQKLTSKDVEYHQKLNAALCFGDELVVTLIEPRNTKTSEIHIQRVIYNYRSTGNPNFEKINESQSCHVNINCSPVGNPWSNQKRGITRIYAPIGNIAGYLTGSLINNTGKDCKPYVLTALNSNINLDDSDLGFWIFYFYYESGNCNNPTSIGSLINNYIFSCFKIADSGNNGGESGSDFLLVQLGDPNNVNLTVDKLKSNGFTAFWNGWNISPDPTIGGVCIHHPAGDVKKISTSSGTTVNSSWNNNGLDSHWKVKWNTNSNGYGVTEGGSIGAPFFNNQGQIIGTLTGGNSSCDSLNLPDYFGKMSYHWESNGTSNLQKLKPWLDPINSGVTVYPGSNNPCLNVPPPIANFTANMTQVMSYSSTTVHFQDLSTGYITNWSWSISPSQGWQIVNSLNSQNASVKFTTAGLYTITLTVSNPYGSSVETKVHYINCLFTPNYCTPEPTTLECEEYIQNVTVANLNHSSFCSDTGYTLDLDYTILLNRGSEYTLSIKPRRINQSSDLGAYPDDQIMAYIDYNSNNYFDPNERIANELVSSASVLEYNYNFTVPQNASYHHNLARMRVMLAYSSFGGVSICSQYEYGETEDYPVRFVDEILENHENELEAVSIYPNPFDNNLKVDLTEVSEEVNFISILDVTGKLIEKINVNQNKIIEIDMSTISKGLYIVRLQSNTLIFDKKVVK